MKKFLNFTTYAILLALTISFTACSTEEPNDILENEKQTLTANSATSRLIKNTVSNDGSWDNIVDESSCFDIKFPYTVMVNGLEVTIDSREDLEVIEEIFDALDSDEDILDIIFPITITKADYTDITINSLADLRELAEQCIEGGNDDDIECIDVIYPVTLFTYNPNLEQTDTVVVTSDMQMRRFFAGLSATDIISIEFPVMFEMYDGTKVTVNNNEELAEAIERAKEACDEDDDDDYNDDDFTEERLDNLLIQCPWLVKEIKIGNQYNTEQYADYLLNFKEDGVVTARDREGNVLEGEWETRISDYRVKLTLEFEFLEDFTLEWFVYEINKDRIKLFVMEGEDKIVLQQACAIVDHFCSDEFIIDVLSECKWVVSSPTIDFIDSYSFDFANMNITILNPNQEIQDEGNWNLEEGVLALNDLSAIFANYIGNWTVVSCSDERVKVERADGEYLVFEKDCD